MAAKKNKPGDEAPDQGSFDLGMPTKKESLASRAVKVPGRNVPAKPPEEPGAMEKLKEKVTPAGPEVPEEAIPRLDRPGALESGDERSAAD